MKQKKSSTSGLGCITVNKKSNNLFSRSLLLQKFSSKSTVRKIKKNMDSAIDSVFWPGTPTLRNAKSCELRHRLANLVARTFAMEQKN